MNKTEYIVVEGGHPLSGTVEIGGAKNSALKLMAASVIAPGVHTISNVPDISDVQVMTEVLETLGAVVRRAGNELSIDTTNLNSFKTPYELVAKMRASISVLGPLIARFGQAKVAMPGGCRIGSRGIDIHMAGLQNLGVSFEADHGYIIADVPNALKGDYINLDFPSVGATENILMASIVADGLTTIENAAREPEIVDLAMFLKSMGANIDGEGTSIIEIEGVSLDSLHATSHKTVGDRIEAGTYLVAGALAGFKGSGSVTVKGIVPENLSRALALLENMGSILTIKDDSIMIEHSGSILPVDIQTLPHPGFPTDLQAQFMVLETLARGSSIITENVFENRFMFASEITRMGADVRIDGNHAIIQGVKSLSGAPVQSADLRGGAALVLAGLVADGQTQVGGVEHIDRGYEHFTQKLSNLGAKIWRE